MKNRAVIFTLMLAAALSIVAGCAKPDAPVSNSTATPVPTPQPPSGKAVYDANGCARCHDSGKAPDLNDEGMRHRADFKWLIAQIKNPKTHKPNSRMPAYEGKISERELQALTQYLSSRVSWHK